MDALPHRRLHVRYRPMGMPRSSMSLMHHASKACHVPGFRSSNPLDVQQCQQMGRASTWDQVNAIAGSWGCLDAQGGSKISTIRWPCRARSCHLQPSFHDGRHFVQWPLDSECKPRCADPDQGRRQHCYHQISKVLHHKTRTLHN